MIDRQHVLAGYCHERTVERRNALVDAYRYLCARGAKKFKRPHNDRADLEQVAAVGLIKAAVNYRPEMRTSFATYAWIMVVGELMHYTRDFERLIRLPRSLYELERRHADAWDRFTAAHHREPTAAELGAALGVAADVILELRSARRADAVAVAGTSPEGAEHVDLLADPAVGIELEERIALASALDELGERDRTIVLGTYAAGLTQLELARRLGISQSHISKLLSRALSKLARRVA